MKPFPAMILLLFFCSCGKVSVDNTDPSIEVLLLNNQESLSDITVGTTINIELYITDNEELVEVVVRIMNVSNSALSQSDKLLHFSSYGNIDSKQFGEVIAVSTNDTHLAGRYELLVQVVDANGNADSRVEEFILLNPTEQPEIEINEFVPPAVDGVILMHPGDSLITQGWISDNIGLVTFKVALTGPQTIHSEQVNTDFMAFAFEWLGKPHIPQNVVTGNYSFNVEATDTDGHMTFYSHPVIID